MNNVYSGTWFDTFLTTITPAQTANEVAFLRQQLPLPDFGQVLDVCCGQGRHSGLLVEADYTVTGVDANASAIEFAKRAVPRARFIQADMRTLSTLAGPFDAVICLWQSFGYFDAQANREVLRQMRTLLRAQGRLVLDVYNAAFFRLNQGTHIFKRNGRDITETKQVDGNRLRVKLCYHPLEETDQFDWQIYDLHELCGLAEEVGFA